MYSYPNRTYCAALGELRKLVSKLNIFNFFFHKGILISLIEEVQTYGNRMEAGLEYGNDLKELHRDRSRLAKEVKALKDEKAELTGTSKDTEKDKLQSLGRRVESLFNSHENENED